MHGRLLKAALHEVIKLALLESNGRAAAPQREAGPHHRWQPDFAQPAAGFLNATHRSPACQIEPDILHRLLESIAALSFIDRVGIRSDHFDAKFL